MRWSREVSRRWTAEGGSRAVIRPISDGRIIRDENDYVTFWVRGKDKAAGNRSRPVELRGKEFVRRWAMHILPNGYTRSRSFGGYHGSKRQDYLDCCRKLLGTATPHAPPSPERVEASAPHCPRREIEMRCILQQRRPSWRDVFERHIYADRSVYSPMIHFGCEGPPAFPYEPDG